MERPTAFRYRLGLFYATIVRRLRSDSATLRFVSGSYANVIIAVAIAVGTILGSRLSEPYNTILVVTGLGGAILAVVLKGGLLWNRFRSGVLNPSSEEDFLAGAPFASEITTAWTSQQGQTWKSDSASAWATYFWHDLAVNDYLQGYRLEDSSGLQSADPTENHPKLLGTMRANRYSLPALLDIIAPHIMWRSGLDRSKSSFFKRLLKRPARFNGHLLRLASEPTVEQLQQGHLQLQHVRYFDGECSNEAWKFILRQKTRAGIQSEKSLMQSYVFNQNGMLKALHEAEAANIIGATILAVTADGYATFVRQSEANAVAGGLLAVTGSGSIMRSDLQSYLAERSDAKSRIRFFRLRRKLRLIAIEDLDDAPVNFFELLWRAMYSRMCAESAIDAPDSNSRRKKEAHEVVQLSSFRCTGYFRWLARSAKPEFSGLIRLKISKNELEMKFRKSVTIDSQSHTLYFVDLKNLSPHELAKGINSTMIDRPGAMNPSSEYTLDQAMKYLAQHPEWLAESLKFKAGEPNHGSEN